MAEEQLALLFSSWGIDPRALWKRKWLILSVTVMSVVCGGAYLLIADPLFEVKTRLYVTRGVDPKGLQAESQEDRYFIGTQAEIIGSPSIVRQALQKSPVALPPGSDEDLMTFVLESLRVAPVVNTHVLSIRFHSQDADEAVGFVAALVDSYQEHLRSVETSTTNQVVDLLTQREAELRGELDALETRHAAQRRKSPLIGQAEKQIEANSAILSEMARKLADVRVRQVELRHKLAALSQDNVPVTSTMLSKWPDPAAPRTGEVRDLPARGGGKDYAYVAVNRVEPGARSDEMLNKMRGNETFGADDLAAIEQELRLAVVTKDRMGQWFGDRHPETRQAAAQIAKWRELRHQFVSETIVSLQHQLDIESATEQSLSELYEAERAEAKRLDDHLVQEELIRSEIARTEEAYNALFSQLTDAQLVDQALSTGRASVIVTDLDGTDRRPEKVWPLPLVLLAACAALGLGSGTLFAFAAEASRKPAVA
jgi:uncharacterized protein involved in exopolysaccharide biosynthesis